MTKTEAGFVQGIGSNYATKYGFSNPDEQLMRKSVVSDRCSSEKLSRIRIG